MCNINLWGTWGSHTYWKVWDIFPTCLAGNWTWQGTEPGREKPWKPRQNKPMLSKTTDPCRIFYLFPWPPLLRLTAAIEVDRRYWGWPPLFFNENSLFPPISHKKAPVNFFWYWCRKKRTQSENQFSPKNKMEAIVHRNGGFAEKTQWKK